MLRLKSFAKINLFLRVCGKRADGYHRLQTLFLSIDLCDELTFRVAANDTCRIECLEGTTPPFEENLIGAAWRLLREEFPGRVPPVTVQIRKRVPSGAGLGGGSSNAAGTLHALNRLCALHLTPAELERRAARLGADAAFFVRGGVQWGGGRGDELHPLLPLPEWPLLVVKPDCSISTREAYAQFGGAFAPALTARELARKTLALRRGEFAAALENSFERALAAAQCAELRARYARVEAARERLLELGCRAAMMTGSGSAVFGIAAQPEQAGALAARLQTEFPFAVAARFVHAGTSA